MPAPVSIVIPTLNAAEELPATLEHLMEGLAAGLIRELVVSDGGSTDATRAIAEAAGAEWISGAPSRGGQLRRGCAAAQGEWLLVIHADTHLQPGWAASAAQHLAEGQGSPACFRLKFRARGLMPAWVAGWANLRTRLFALPYGDQGLLIRCETYEAAGGYPDQPLMEDVALVRRLGTITLLPCAALTSAARYQRAGWLRRGTRNLWTLMRYFLGVKPETLAKSYGK